MKDVFQGKVSGFPEISVDYFLGSRLKCSAFFLSHCHTDHIKGIDSQEFKEVLQLSEAKIYATFMTASLVLRRSKLSYLKKHFVYLENNEMYTIPVSKSDTINVTLLDANHCPGSVMFLFSTSTYTALYTGDFRFNQDSEAYTILAETEINSLYIDTTFFTPKLACFYKFPSRKESEEAAVTFVLNEKEKCTRLNIHVDVTPGWENVFIALAKKFNCLVQVSPELYYEYEEIDDVILYLTKEKSWLHVNKTNAHCVFCEDSTLQLRPSIQWKLHNNSLNSRAMIASKTGTKNVWYITHSMHSSYSECKSFINMIGADKVYPIATPPKMTNIEISNLLMKYWKAEKKIVKMVANTDNSRAAIPSSSVAGHSSNAIKSDDEIFEDTISTESDDCLPVHIFHGAPRSQVVEIQDKINIVSCSTAIDSDIHTIEIAIDSKCKDASAKKKIRKRPVLFNSSDSDTDPVQDPETSSEQSDNPFTKSTESKTSVAESRMNKQRRKKKRSVAEFSDYASDSDCNDDKGPSSSCIAEKRKDVQAAVAAWLSSSSDSDRTLPPDSDVIASTANKFRQTTPSNTMSPENLNSCSKSKSKPPTTCNNKLNNDKVTSMKTDDYLNRLYAHFLDSD